jgi:hypothetical protein
VNVLRLKLYVPYRWSEKDEASEDEAETTSTREISGIVGVKRLLLSTYLVVVLDKELVGSLFDQHPIFRIRTFEIIPFGDVDPATPKKLVRNLKKKAYLRVLLSLKILITSSISQDTTVRIVRFLKQSSLIHYLHASAEQTE